MKQQIQLKSIHRSKEVPPKLNGRNRRARHQVIFVSDLFKLVLEASTLGIHGACTSTKESENAPFRKRSKRERATQNSNTLKSGATKKRKHRTTSQQQNKIFCAPSLPLPSSPPPTPQRAMSTATLTATPQELFVTPTKPQRQAKDEVATPVDEPVRPPSCAACPSFRPAQVLLGSRG